jgi:hypothetical protein
MAAFKQLLEAEHLICRFLAKDTLGTARATLALLLGFGRPATAVLVEKRLELSQLARQQLAQQLRQLEDRIEGTVNSFTGRVADTIRDAPAMPQTPYQRNQVVKTHRLANFVRGCLGFPELSAEEMFNQDRERQAMRSADRRLVIFSRSSSSRSSAP